MSFLNKIQLFGKDLITLFKGNPGIVVFQVGLNDIVSDGFILVRQHGMSAKMEFRSQFPMAFSLTADKARKEVVRQARELKLDVIYLAVKKGNGRGYYETTVNTTLFPKE